MPGGATRRVSLHEPDARPIAKGRLGKPVEFGYKAQVTDNDDGVVLDYAVEQGNPADGPQLAPAIGRVIKRTGKKPRTVTADRGYGEKPIEDDPHATSPSRARAGPARPARPPNAGPRSAEPSSGEPAAKAASAPSNGNRDGTAPAWTAPKEPRPGPDTGSWPTTWSRSAHWPADPRPGQRPAYPHHPPDLSPTTFSGRSN
jgi:Transposase DDE domain